MYKQYFIFIIFVIVAFLNLEIIIALIVAIPGELGEINMIQTTENKKFL